MRRVTVTGGYVLALAEPDYSSRVDRPRSLAWLGQRQNAALERQGVALHRGAELKDLFNQTGITLIETGVIRPPDSPERSAQAWASEWNVLEADLADTISADEMSRIRELHRSAWLSGTGSLSVPTYFAWGQV
jgi:hypothetical protein